MNISFFEIEDKEIPSIKKRLAGHNLSFYDFALNSNTKKFAIDSDIVSVFIYSRLDSTLISEMHNLKLISTRSTGFDHIDLAACRQKNVLISNIPLYGERTVAEHAFSLLLSLSRNTHRFHERSKNGLFNSRGLECVDLNKKNIGIVGTGKIGQSMAKIAKGFDMNVFAFDIFKNENAAKDIGFQYCPLEELVSKCDFISLHLPLNKDTRHLFNKELFNKFKKGSILVNTSRGGIIDTSALLNALDEQIISAAGLDVIDEEKEVFNKDSKSIIPENIQSLIGRENVIITPHVGFYSAESVQRIMNTTIDNIENFISQAPINIVGS